MRAKSFLDTNILLYAASRQEEEQEKRKVARDLFVFPCKLPWIARYA